MTIVHPDEIYLNLLMRVMQEGHTKDDRTGTGTTSIFGHQMRFNLADSFPLLTTKKLHLASIIHELIWFLSGDTNIKYLNDNGVKIWDDWADKNGNLGPVYGAQWRSWPIYHGDEGILRVEPKTLDQIANVINQLRNNPDSRRMIVSAWNPAQVDEMALPPCHCLFQFYSREMTVKERKAWLNRNIGKDEEDVPRRVLSCQLYQRSADIFLGVPFNIASYALLTHMIAHVTGHAVGEFVHTLGDAHLYLNHIEQANEQLSRTPRGLPQLVLDGKHSDIDSFTADHIWFKNYHPQPAIKAPIAI